MSESYNPPYTPERGDTQRQLLVKVLNALLAGYGGGGTAMVFTGSGSPEGVVTAPVGAIYNEITGGVVIAQWVKASGSGNTGWV